MMAHFPRLRSVVVFGCYVMGWAFALRDLQLHVLLALPVGLLSIWGAGLLGQMSADAEYTAERMTPLVRRGRKR